MARGGSKGSGWGATQSSSEKGPPTCRSMPFCGRGWASQGHEGLVGRTVCAAVGIDLGEELQGIGGEECKVWCDDWWEQGDDVTVDSQTTQF